MFPIDVLSGRQNLVFLMAFITKQISMIFRYVLISCSSNKTLRPLTTQNFNNNSTWKSTKKIITIWEVRGLYNRFSLNNITMRLNIGHSQCTRGDNVDGNFFNLKFIWRDVYLCLKSTVNRKSIYSSKSRLHKSDYNDCKYIIVIFIEAGFRRLIVNAISGNISHEIPRLNEDFDESIFKLKRQAKMRWKKKSLFIIFRGYLSF